MGTKLPLSVLFVGKKDDEGCERAVALLKERFAHVSAFLGGWKEPFPAAAAAWSGDLIISYLGRWIVPGNVLARAKVAAINFHPAPPNYPGVGCNNFALYDGAHEFGVTCHHMAAKVDTGAIIAVRRFPIQPVDDVASLLSHTYEEQFKLLREIVDLIAAGQPLPQPNETWTRRPYTRKELEELATLRPDMSPQEIGRRIRATSFGPWQPTLQVGPYRFVYQPDR